MILIIFFFQLRDVLYRGNRIIILLTCGELTIAFVSQKICQDPLQNYFGCQRQRGGTSDNPSVHESYQNTETFHVIDSLVLL